jgi:hypothetical protein
LQGGEFDGSDPCQPWPEVKKEAAHQTTSCMHRGLRAGTMGEKGRERVSQRTVEHPCICHATRSQGGVWAIPEEHTREGPELIIGVMMYQLLPFPKSFKKL